MKYFLRKYNNNDYEFIYELKKNAYKDYVIANWGDWNEEDQKKYYHTFIETYKDNTYIIQVDGKDIGFYNDEYLDDGTYEIGNICIMPEYQGKGIGTMVLNDKIKENQDKDIIIQYFKQNPVGKLYQRLGFEPLNEKPYHYQMIKLKR